MMLIAVAHKFLIFVCKCGYFIILLPKAFLLLFFDILNSLNIRQASQTWTWASGACCFKGQWDPAEDCSIFGVKGERRG